MCFHILHCQTYTCHLSAYVHCYRRTNPSLTGRTTLRRRERRICFRFRVSCFCVFVWCPFDLRWFSRRDGVFAYIWFGLYVPIGTDVAVSHSKGRRQPGPFKPVPCHGTCTCFSFRFVALVLVLLLFDVVCLFGKCISKMALHLSLGPLLLSPILKETATRPLFGCVGSSSFAAVPLTSVPKIVTIVPLFLFFHEFPTRGGGEVPLSSEACHDTESPDTKRGVPSLHL